ncbi:MAG TPA: hypothetical protein VGL93_10445 [Streptosporangiaceae bacterium]|jgi:hypothetical protein
MQIEMHRPDSTDALVLTVTGYTIEERTYTGDELHIETVPWGSEDAAHAALTRTIATAQKLGWIAPN